MAATSVKTDGITSTTKSNVRSRTLNGVGMVKAVTSGDSLLLLGSAINNSNNEFGPEKSLTLSGIVAPKFSKSKNTKDEPFAFESREFLRQQVIGKQVSFAITFISENGREYGNVTLNGIDLSIAIVRAGWAKVKDGATDKQGNVRPEFIDLMAAQQEAQNLKIGMWTNENAKDHIRQINYIPDVKKLFERYKSQPLNAIVDKVIDGSTLRVELVNVNPKPLHHIMIQLCLAGVQCARTPLPLSVLQAQYDQRVNADPSIAQNEERPTSEEEAQPFSKEAQNFTETRLLNRSVQVLLQGIDKANNLYGTILFSKGNISLKLLELGYGKFVAWSAQTTNDFELLQKAAQSAKEKKLRIWQNYTDTNEIPSGTQYDAKIIQVVSGDTLALVDSNGREIRAALASVRCPRLGRRGDKDEPHAQAAKEFMRSRLIGHRVRVVVEYLRPVTPDSEEQRQYVSILLNKQNVTEQLLLAGLATVIRHGREEPRSQFYDSYVQAESTAMKTQQGLHSKKPSPVTRIVDLTDRVKPSTKEDGAILGNNKSISAKAKQLFNQLSRASQINAVVEYCVSGSRFKLFFPRESMIAAFALSAVRTPVRTEKDTKWHAAALEYVKTRLQQHSVTVKVEAQDRNDTLIGHLFFTQNNRTVNLAVALLEEGLATLFERSAERSEYKDELFAAQQLAKSVKKGLWVDYVEPVVEPMNNEDETGLTDGNSEFINVRVTEIESCRDFYVHFVDSKDVSVIEEAMTNFKDTASDLGPLAPTKEEIKSGLVCAGLFTDDSWHRVKVEGIVGGGEEYRVKFIDYGNHSILPSDHLRALPESLAKIQPLAHHATLAGLKAPLSDEYRESAALEFNALVWDQQLLAKIEYHDRKEKVLHLTLLQETSPVSINKQLLDAGFARVNKRVPAKLKPLLEELQPHEDSARKNRYNIFEYGDAEDDEEEDSQRGSFSRRR